MGMHAAAEGALTQLRRIQPAPDEVELTFGVAVNGKLGATLDQSSDTAGPVRTAPGGEVPVELPFADDVVVRRATVVGWQPIQPDRSGDVALLRLDEPVTVTPAPLACPPSVSGHRFSVHGFPRGEPPARQATGVLGGASGPAGEWIQIESVRSTGWPVEHGSFGAPIFDHDAEAVVGIVALRDQHRSGHMLPVS